MAKTYRIQVMISEEMKERLEKLSKQTGCSMSAMCNMWISQGSLSYEMALDKMSEVADKWIEENRK